MGFTQFIDKTAEEWTAENPKLDAGVFGREFDLNGGTQDGSLRVKIGDGVTHWNDLDYSITNNTPILTSYLATTVTYNNTAALADTPLSVPVVAGGIYDIYLVVHSTSAVTSLLLDFGGTATVTNFIGQYQSSLQSGALAMGLRVTAAGSDFQNPDADGDNAVYFFNGSIEVNTAGTFLLRGAQNLADASNTTILRGSTLTLTKLN